MTREKQKKLEAFYTPDALADKLVDCFTEKQLETDNFFDPTAGDGSLIRALIRRGVDPKRCYANELDGESFDRLVANLLPLGVPAINLFNKDVFDEELWVFLYCLVDHFSLIINPPFSKGNKIVSFCIQHMDAKLAF